MYTSKLAYNKSIPSRYFLTNTKALKIPFRKVLINTYLCGSFKSSSSIMRNIFILVISLFFIIDLSAQDKHFTQFYASPLTLNPALTGAYNGRYRVSTIYRDQWRRVLDSPFRTFATELDVRFDVNTNSQYKDAAAIGLVFFRDKVSGIDLGTQQIALSGAYHKGLDYDKKQFLTVGFQGAIAQRNVNFEQLTFGDEFNGFDGYTFDTEEELPLNNFSYGDISVGINYAFTPKPRKSFYAGFAMHHILQPEISFYRDETDDLGEPIASEKLYTRLSAQLSAELPISEVLSVSPRLLIAKQGSHLQMNTGANLRFMLNDFSHNSLYIGGWVRPVANEDDFGLDALVLMMGLQQGSFLFGLSYDVNLKDLTTYQQGQAAFELSISYFGDFENDSILCPRF